MKKYRAVEESGADYEFEAAGDEQAEGIATKWCRGGTYDEEIETFWIRLRIQRLIQNVSDDESESWTVRLRFDGVRDVDVDG